MKLKGRLEEGKQVAADFLAIPWVCGGLIEKLGFEPFPGTLNLRLTDPESLAAFKKLVEKPSDAELTSPDPNFCNASLYPAVLNGSARTTIVWPHVPGQPEDIVELVSPESLRIRFRLNIGDECEIAVGPDAVVTEKRHYKAVLFDFEGTLVDFQWKLAEAEGRLLDELEKLGFDLKPFKNDNYAQMRTRALDTAPGEAVKNEIDRVFGEIYDEYDEDALTRWQLKPRAREILETLTRLGVKTAIISNVGRKGLSGALTKLGLNGVVETIVTRNDVSRAKPSGEGLTKVLNQFGLLPGDALMVGDSLSDLWAAREAGTPVAILLGGESPTPALAEARPEHLINTLAALAAVI